MNEKLHVNIKKKITSKKYSHTFVPLIRRKHYFVLGIILLLTLISYLPVLHNNLLAWDDHAYIKDNKLVYSINIKEIFTSYIMGNYHPLTILIHAIEYQIFGLSAIGYHSVNLLLHLMIVMIVFYALFLITAKVELALFVSLLFGIHPLHVESVAWAAELKDLLFSLFFLTSYVFYLKYIKDNNKRYLYFTLFLFLLSLLSKAMAASFPILLFLTDYFKGRKLNVKTLIEKIPFFILALLFGIIAIMAQKSTDAISSEISTIFTFPQRIAFASYGFMTYLSKLLLPINLSAYYPYPLKNGDSIPMQYYVYLFIFIVFIGSVLYSIRFTKKILFGIGFFSITVFLVLQLLPVGEALIADRYSYIPSIGIFYLFGEGVFYFWKKSNYKVILVLICIISVFLSSFTYRRCSIWNNELSLWNDVISQYKYIPMAYYNRGAYYSSENKTDEALKDYNKAIELKPNYPGAYNNRGLIYMGNKDYLNALKDYSTAIDQSPNFIMAYHNRGVVLYYESKFDEAIKDFTKAIELKPDNAVSYFSKGMAENNLDKKESACKDWQKALSLGYQPAKDMLNKFCN